MTTTVKDGGDDGEKYAVSDDLVMLEPNLKGDWLNYFLLMLLYTMQGFPLGFTSAISIVLQSKKDISYQDQAWFSLSVWPFSLKLLWAPLVDSLYVQKIGRRKSWIVPVQYLMGIGFLFMAKDIDVIMPETGNPNIMELTYMFFVANFLAATQDIIVDGWALSMLKKNNVGHASTCNTTGQTFGEMLGAMFPVLLTSEDFCNRYLRSEPDSGGLVTMASLLYIWGVIFIMVTTLIAIFKKEKDITLDDNYVKLSVVQNYSLLSNILKLPSIQILAIALLTSRVGFCVTDTVTSLKLIEAGVSKDNITIINTIMSIIKIFIPLVTAKFTSGPKPMSIYLNSSVIKLFWNLTFILLIYYTPKFEILNGIVIIPFSYNVILVFILLVDEILFFLMFVALIAFFSRISDSRFGGTYVTFLNTVTNLGVAWTSTVALGLIDLLTIKKCSIDSNNNCSSITHIEACEAIGGDCVTIINGFYVGTLLSMFFGSVWYGIFKNILRNLQTKELSSWIVNVKRTVIEHMDNS